MGAQSVILCSIQFVISFWNTDVIKILLKHCTSTTIQDNNGQTRIDFAHKNNNKEAVSLLQHSSKCFLNNNGQTTIDFARNKNNEEAVCLLQHLHKHLLNVYLCFKLDSRDWDVVFWLIKRLSPTNIRTKERYN